SHGGREETLAADTVIKATGQTPLSAFFAAVPDLVFEGNRPLHDPVTMQTGNPRYFVGGDGANGGKEVVNAVAEGKRAARGIDRWLRPRRSEMADLAVTFAGVRSPNPFWLASAPPTNTGDQVMRAFDAGWGGAVWKTIGEPIVNVASRYAAVDLGGTRIMGLNNIELITDRPLDVNLRELAE